MTKTIVNLSLPLVIQETETILATYPHYPYQKAFSVPDLRQKLICYVLSRMPGIYTVVDEANQHCVKADSMCPTSDNRRLQMETLIRQGIETILAEDAEWVSRHIPEEIDAAFAPSNWFG